LKGSGIIQGWNRHITAISTRPTSYAIPSSTLFTTSRTIPKKSWDTFNPFFNQIVAFIMRVYIAAGGIETTSGTHPME